MGVQEVPSKKNFTAFLRRMVRESERKGYSRKLMTQGGGAGAQAEKGAEGRGREGGGLWSGDGEEYNGELLS